MPANRTVKVIDTGDEIIGATEYGLVRYNRNDDRIYLFNKVQGLSDFGISTLEYFSSHDLIFIGYQNGNIDIIRNNTVHNVPDIRLTTAIMGSKRINNVALLDENLYVATDFGIVQIGVQQLVVFNTFLIGDDASVLQVNDILVHDGSFYAATAQGMLVADVDAPNLADFNSWEALENEPVEEGFYNSVFTAFDKLFLWNSAGDLDQIFYLEDETWVPFFPDIEGTIGYFNRKNGMGFSNNRLWVAYEGAIDLFNNDFELVDRIDSYGFGSLNPQNLLFDNVNMWIADFGVGVIRRNEAGQFQSFLPESPSTAMASGLASSPAAVWVAPGSITSGGQNNWNYDGALFFENERWRSATRFNIPGLDGVFDIVRVVADPGNSKQAYFASWSRGLFKLTTDRDFTLYDETNSTLQRRSAIGDQVRIGGAAFDRNRNLWVTNSEVDRPISVMRNNGQWLSFDTKGLVGNNQVIGNITVDNSNQKWVIIPGNGIIVLKENTLENSNDFEVRRLTTLAGNGSLPSNYVYSMAVDQSGYVWVGTQAGVAVFYNPQNVLTQSSIDAHLPIVVQDGFAGLLLENDQVNTIFVDGGNNKWFGTSRSGAFFMTPDARNTYLHFTIDNSPLPSNNILDITVAPETGEVFFATDKGLASFRNFATAASETHQEVYAYPNPVKPGYDGYIAIKGLVRNAHVKITDINGNLVYETRAQGGQAIWNGRDLNGRKPSSGVYTVFSTNDDGSETAVTKILFIR